MIRGVVAALVALVLMAAWAPGTDARERVAPSVYRADSKAIVVALTRFSRNLQGARSLEALEDRVSRLQLDLRLIDRKAERMGGYSLKDRRLNRQRAAFVRHGPRTATALRAFLTAVLSRSSVRVARTETRAKIRLRQFSDAVNGFTAR